MYFSLHMKIGLLPNFRLPFFQNFFLSVKLVDKSSVVVENTGLKLEGLDEKAAVQGISVDNDKFKIMIMVGLSYMSNHSWWLACSLESTI